ncbi:ion transporter [Lentisphaerota bacterium WC36G]|nr:ion transporter [Lentisphaerae bacterium WC36]
MKKKLSDFVENSRLFNYGIILLIIINILAVILQSVNVIEKKFDKGFLLIEDISIIIFTVEYIIRFIALKDKYKRSWYYFFSPMAIIDLLAIMPFYLPFIGIDLRFMRIFRIFRIIRVAKLVSYISVLELFKRVVKKEKDALILTSFIMITSIIISSVLIYYAEYEAQPSKFSSIPASMWWAIVSLTTIGYGDMYPITVIGKTIASIMALIGIAIIAMPTGIISAAFIAEINYKNRQKCPHCNKSLDLE